MLGSARTVDVAAWRALVEATARPTAASPARGTVLVLAVPATDGATALLVVNGDTADGPEVAPPTPSRATLDAIVASARPAGI